MEINFRVASYTPEGEQTRLALPYFDPSASDRSALRHIYFFFICFKSTKNLVSEEIQDTIASMLYINVYFF